MTNRSKRTFGTAGFYTTLVLCLVAVGVGAYFLLFRSPASTADSKNPEEQETVSVAAETPQVKIPNTAANSSGQNTGTDNGGKPDMPEEEVDADALATVDSTPVVAEAPNLVVSPLNGDIVAAFSVDQLAYSKTLDDWRTHDGIDIAAADGTTVLAASAGTVLSVEADALMGTTVTLSHAGGYETTYANLQEKPTVSKGDTVSAGQVLGAVGSTSIAEAAEGPHLHFSVSKNGKSVDPNKFLKS